MTTDSFANFEEMKAELRDMATPEAKETRKSAVRVMSDLHDALDEAIEVFSLLNPEAMAEFDARVELKRANSDKFGAPTRATALEKNMELRSEAWFPSVTQKVKGAHGRIRTRYMSLKDVIAGIYRAHGFENFPNAEGHAEFLMLNDFKKRYPRFFVASEL